MKTQQGIGKMKTQIKWKCVNHQVSLYRAGERATHYLVVDGQDSGLSVHRHGDEPWRVLDKSRPVLSIPGQDSWRGARKECLAYLKSKQDL